MNAGQRFAGIGGHHSNRAQTVEWLTPPAILAALGGAASFDLDPATPEVQPWPTAKARYTKADDGLAKPWFGRVWLNPPYSNGVIGRWLEKLAMHGCGSTIIFARTETDAFFRHVWQQAHALLFLRGRVKFHKPDGSLSLRKDGRPADAGAPTVLCAYGDLDMEILAACGLNGQFVPLIFPRGALVQALADVTWREALSGFLAAHGAPIALADLYCAFADHPKSKQNPHWREKLRQTLQAGAGKRIGRGQWVAA